jgi:hypothetical protein
MAVARAVGAAYAALGIAVLGQSALADPPNNSARADQRPSIASRTPSQGQAPTAPSSIDTAAQRIAGALESKNAYDQSAKGQQDAHEAAKAARDAANWAGGMLVAAWLETLVTLAGVVLVGLTLREARRSASEAKRGADEMRRSADAALKAAETAERSLTDLERPYLYMNPSVAPQSMLPREGYVPGAATMPLGIRYAFKNSGRTYARIIESSNKVDVVGDVPEDPDYAGLLIGKGLYYLDAGENGSHFKTAFNREVSADEWAEITGETLTVIFFGYVRYVDIFGRVHKNAFGVRWHPSINSFSAVGMENYNYDETEGATATSRLYRHDPQTGDLDGPWGTGVFVGVPANNQPSWAPWVRHIYAVTCHHVVTGKIAASVIRVNTKDGGTAYIELEPHEWTFDPAVDDVAICDVTDRFKANEWDATCVPRQMLVSRDYLDQRELAIGEDGFMLGLFGQHSRSERNIVAARFGNVSILAQDTAPVKLTGRPAHVFDMKSRPGFSGSPVFIYRTPDTDLSDLLTPPTRFGLGPFGVRTLQDAEKLLREVNKYLDSQARDRMVAMLGVHVGQYRDEIEARKVTDAEEHIPLHDGDWLYVPSSMTIVAPAWSVLELIDRPREQERRIQREKDEPQPLTVPETNLAQRPYYGRQSRRPPHAAPVVGPAKVS